MLPLISKFFLYGILGWAIEIFFTGIGELVNRRWKAIGQSSFWMFPVYAITALILEAVSAGIQQPFYLKAFIYVPIFYGSEALSGLAICWLTRRLHSVFSGTQQGEIPWSYPQADWTLFGLINPKMVWAWFILALLFDFFSSIMGKFVVFITG